MKPGLAIAALATAALATATAPPPARAEPYVLVEPRVDLLWSKINAPSADAPSTFYTGGGLLGTVGYALDDIVPFQGAAELIVAGSVFAPEHSAGSFTAALGTRGGFELPPFEASIRFHAGYGYVADAGAASHNLALHTALGVGGRVVTAGGARTVTFNAVASLESYVGRSSAQGIGVGVELGFWFGEHRDLWWSM